MCLKLLRSNSPFEESSEENNRDPLVIQKKLSCPSCAIKCESAWTLFVHQKIAHLKRKTSNQPIECNCCKQVFWDEGILQMHTCSSHVKTIPDSREYICQTCGDVFSNKEYFIEHIQLHAERLIEADQESIVCTHCGTSFVDEEALKKHSKVHKDPTYFCILCFEKFNTQAEQALHIKTTHLKQSKHVCHLCDSVCSSRGAMQVHVWKFHQYTIEQSPVYGCIICGTTIRSRDTFSLHMLQHGPQ